MGKDKKKSKNRLAFEKAARGKIVECQMTSLKHLQEKSETSKQYMMFALMGFRRFVADEFNKVGAEERAGYEKYLRKRIKKLDTPHPKLKQMLTRIVDECEANAPAPISE